MTTNELFFIMLRAAVWNSPPQLPRVPEPEEWRILLGMSKAHSLQGVMFDAVMELPAAAGVPRQLAAEWMIEADCVEKDYAAKKAMTAAQMEFWKSNGIDAVLLKGVSVAAFYPVPEHRVVGDIDWWMPGRDNWRKALELVRAEGYSVSRDSDGDCSYVSGGIVVEHHRKGMREKGAVGMLVMLNEHILHHVMVGGIGMRHLCDMALAYRHFSGSYDAGEYLCCLKKYGLAKWNELLNAALKRTLAVPDDILPGASIGVTSADAGRLVDMIMEDGDFGFGRRRRFSGFSSRFSLFMRYAPWLFVKRWAGLVIGRITFTIFAN